MCNIWQAVLDSLTITVKQNVRVQGMMHLLIIDANECFYLAQK